MAIRLHMSRHSAAATDRASTLSFWLLIAFLAILWVAGGASRADVLGQSVVRFSAWSIIVVAILALPRVDWRVVKEPAIILGAVALLVTLQLVPLPPAIWTEFPGRAIFTEAAVLAGMDQPWRPLSISPSGTSNALASLIVPGVVLLLAANLTREQHWRIAVFVLAMVGAGAMLGVLQFSGANFNNPLINTPPGSVAGNFANRNHFALFLAIGCVIAVAWAFRAETIVVRTGAAFASLLIFILIALATGSRGGAVIVLIGILLAIIAVWSRIARQLIAIPRKTAVLLVAVVVAIAPMAVWLSNSLDRAVSIDRAAIMDSDADLRLRIWPIVLDMFQNYFPAGTGFGTFDAVFRIYEPHVLLNPKYVNLAHNEWLQIPMEGGLLGLLLLVATIFWFAWRSFGAWSFGSKSTNSRVLARVGSIVVILFLAASATDYPARTPLMMALLILAVIWLGSKNSSKLNDE